MVDISHIPQETLSEYQEILSYFREEYHPNAQFFSHFEYLQKLYNYKKVFQRYPTRTEFFLFYHPECFCEHTPTVEEYLDSTEFFIKHIGTLRGLDCTHFYVYKYFKIVLQRPPDDSHEYFNFLQTFLYFRNTSVFYEEVRNTIDSIKIEQLRDRIFVNENTETDCGICQETIKIGQNVLKLDCGHYFHTNDNDCCGRTIFTWFETKMSCPMCRGQV